MGKRKRSGSFSKYDDCSKRSDDGDSQEELDGDSAGAQKGNLAIANGIRYSARVQEKQEKLRRESSPSKQTVPEPTSIAAIPPPCPPLAKIVPHGEESAEVYPPCERTFISQSINISGEKKKKRTWELWSQEDKQLFFEALNEYGKDFDAIQNYVASKLKPRSKGSCAQTLPKNKDQVRHFYYRTWNKISKYLTFPKDMKKAYQELYGLINYGELRKKQRVLNMKTAVKLSELVEKGTSTIKVRGKTFRIKTPVCRALKKLNQLEDIDHIRVPCKLCVELVPRDGSTWTSVQRVSHNPRVKVYVPLQRTLASLIIYFEERWKTDQNRLKEEFSLTVFGKPKTRLRFFPVESRDLSVPVFKFSEVTSATKISLSSYVQNCLHQGEKQESALVSKKFKRKPKLESDSGIMTHRDADYLAAEADVSDADGCEALPENQFRITLRRDKFPSGNQFIGMKSSEVCFEHESSNGFPDNALWSVHEENANAAAETDAGETDYGFDENAPSPTECDENTGDEDCMDQVMTDNPILDGFLDLDCKEDKQGLCTACKFMDGEDNGIAEKFCTCNGNRRMLEPESIKVFDAEATARGWNADEAGALTLGEIYLMLGKSDKLCFEYTWDKGEEDKLLEERARNLVDKLVSVARQLKKKKSNRAKISTTSSSVATSTPIVCIKCNHKVESPGSTDSELPPNTSASIVVLKDSPTELHSDESPTRTTPLQQQNNGSDDNKITLHAVVNVDSPPAGDVTIGNDANAPELSPKCESQETQTVALTPEAELLNTRKDEGTSTQGLISADNVNAAAVPDSTSSNVCSNQQPLIAPQTGLIELSALATEFSTDLDGSFRRITPNINAAIIPTSAAIIRSVALTSNVMTDATNSTCNLLATCGTLSPVTTTTVLVSDPGMFAGIATETTPFVTIQQCSAASVSPPPNLTQNTQDTKFRRPADVPIPIKPRSDDQSTNEDGSAKLNVPKPFLDLPKGNRRIGRRPAWKQRVIIPRMLPLLPKPDANATVTTLITIPPVVATGLSVVPVTTENLNSLTSLSIASDLDLAPTSTTAVSPAISLASGVAIPVSSIPTTFSPNENMTVTSTVKSGAVVSGSGATSSSKVIDSGVAKATTSADKTSTSKSTIGFEESLDNLSLSSFMDISIPESTRFMANDLRFDDLECSNSSVNLSGMLDETSRRNSRDPPLLDTPKKQSGSDDVSLEMETPDKLTMPSMDAWSAMNEGMDFSMGSLFNGNESLRTNSNEPLSEGELTFQSVIGVGSLDFESKLSDFTSLNDRSKE